MLETLVPNHDFFVAVDSDGCAFDTMELKHKECFIPNIVKHWGLQPVSKYARRASEFVNLYSKWRGLNRFPALIRTVELLREWPEVLETRAELPDLVALEEWVARETKLSNPTLEAELERTGSPVLSRALQWSRAVNQDVTDMVHGVPPFPGVRECLERLAERADLIVCSATPARALQAEWGEHGLDRFVKAIAGQEMGSKAEHIRVASGGQYDPNQMLMIGDAPGDLRAARANRALFFPIMPGHERSSWGRLFDEGIARFLDGIFSGDYQDGLIQEFETVLPEVPYWK